MLTCPSTCLEMCDFNLAWSPFLTQLLEHDVPISTSFFSTPSTSRAEWIQRSDFANYEHLLESSGTYTAIVLKDDSRFSELVSNGQALLDSHLEDSNMYEIAAAMSWTEGCKPLIDAYRNGVKLQALPDEYFESVIAYGDLDFLQFWLNIRPDLDESDLIALGGLEFALNCALDDDIAMPDMKKVDAIIAALVKQRRDLGALAAKQSSEADYSPNHDRLLDVKAWEICDTLEEQGVDVPPALIPSRKCIYHLSHEYYPFLCATTVLERLYEAGFKDLCGKDHLDAKGTFVTPLLLYLSHAPYIDDWNITSSILGWFLAKGSDLDERWPGSPSKGTHLLGCMIGTYILQEEHVGKFAHVGRFAHFFSPGFYDWISVHTASSQAILGEDQAHYSPTQGVLDVKLWQDIREALAEKTPDRCNCHCSSSGCVPMSLLCKTVLANSQVLGSWTVRWSNEDCKYAIRTDAPSYYLY
jgi:hypothetical protein